jgi:hypothetical protein
MLSSLRSKACTAAKYSTSSRSPRTRARCRNDRHAAPSTAGPTSDGAAPGCVRGPPRLGGLGPQGAAAGGHDAASPRQCEAPAIEAERNASARADQGSCRQPPDGTAHAKAVDHGDVGLTSDSMPNWSGWRGSEMRATVQTRPACVLSSRPRGKGQRLPGIRGPMRSRSPSASQPPWSGCAGRRRMGRPRATRCHPVASEPGSACPPSWCCRRCCGGRWACSHHAGAERTTSPRCGRGRSLSARSIARWRHAVRVSVPWKNV